MWIICELKRCLISGTAVRQPVGINLSPNPSPTLERGEQFLHSLLGKGGEGGLGDLSNTLSDSELVIITLFKSPKVFWPLQSGRRKNTLSVGWEGVRVQRLMNKRVLSRCEDFVNGVRSPRGVGSGEWRVGSTDLHNCICEVHCQTLQILYKKDCSFTKQSHTLLIKSPV
jgi:hypothetical protein